WAAGGIENPEVADNTVMMAWPAMPGEKAGGAGSVGAAIQVGYGLTKAGAADENVKAAAMRFLDVFYSEEETTQRLRDGAIVAPILKGYQTPSDLPAIIAEKVRFAQSVALQSDVVDAFLSGAPNDTLNAGMQKIVAGQSTPAEVAAEVEGLLR
ncbi:MAG: carbohydrate ABC transporter substrate-binding protein, partial [Spirochaetales bacterium]|nr:carbohydrate ABC transporter substrate-binding protein [Spirochaetales bacterium]